MKKFNLKTFTAALLSVVLITASGCTIELPGGTIDINGNSSTTGNHSEKQNVSIDPNISPSFSDNSGTLHTNSSEFPFNNNGDDNIDSKSFYVTGVTDPIALRQRDDDSSEVLAQLDVGTEVKFISADSATCYFVKYEEKNLKGYINKYFVTDEKSAVCKRENYYVSKETTLYSTNDSDKQELGKIKKGQAVYVCAKNSGDYWYVNIKDTKDFGFVKCTDLTTTKPESSSSSTSSKKDTSYPTGSGKAPSSYVLYYAKVQTGYLAIRKAKAFDSSNELGRMYTGDEVYVIDTSTGKYWYCYSPILGILGYVNSDYLVSTYPGTASPNNDTYTVWSVRVEKNYLALRYEPAYDASNEIYKLYTGDTVYVYSYSYYSFSDKYWYVYSPKAGMWGYVDSNFIYR